MSAINNITIEKNIEKSHDMFIIGVNENHKRPMLTSTLSNIACSHWNIAISDKKITRNPKNYDLELDGVIEFGVSPRASIWLILAAKANALLSGRGFVIPEDVKSIAHDVMRHRIILTFEAEAEGQTSDGYS